MATDDFELRLARRLGAEERAGLRLAVQGRLAVLAVLAAFSLIAFRGPLLLNTLLYLGAFALLSVALLFVSRGARHRPWAPYVFVFLEVALLGQAVLSPNPFNPEPWPAPMVFRYDNFYYFFVLLAVSAFALSPRLVLWTGVCIALVWGAGVVWVLGLPQTREWSEVAAGLSSAETLRLYMDPQMVLASGRAKEILVTLLASGLLAAVVHRARRIVRRMMAVEADRRLLRETFGKYLPERVVRALLADRGTLAPRHRLATVLFVDVAGFTALAQSMQPREVLVMINEFFEAASAVLARHRGIVNQFQGDAILATFNVPLDDPQHAANAVAAGHELLALVDSRTFSGRTLGIRVGINTGEVVAGSVGGSARLSYTVHGDAVNLAARLEDLNKETGTRMLISEATVSMLPAPHGLERLATVLPRGMSAPVAVYAPPRHAAPVDEAAVG